MSTGQSLHPSSNGGPHATKKVQKNRNNYASVECGAKILAANPEAKVFIVYKFFKKKIRETRNLLKTDIYDNCLLMWVILQLY